MMPSVIVDTGPLVAYFDRRDRYHDWAKAHLGPLQVALATCEPVITEACFLLRRSVTGAERDLLNIVSQRRLVIPFKLADEVAAITNLMNKYANVPMSLADACLVRIAELYAQSRVLTLDSDFRIYRLHGQSPIDVTLPELGH
jgi:predicted nucleic acid-binding protein